MDLFRSRTVARMMIKVLGGATDPGLALAAGGLPLAPRTGGIFLAFDVQCSYV